MFWLAALVTASGAMVGPTRHAGIIDDMRKWQSELSSLRTVLQHTLTARVDEARVVAAHLSTLDRYDGPNQLQTDDDKADDKLYAASVGEIFLFRHLQTHEFDLDKASHALRDQQGLEREALSVDRVSTYLQRTHTSWGQGGPIVMGPRGVVDRWGPFFHHPDHETMVTTHVDAAALSASPSHVTSDTGSITLSWSGIKHAADNDWIGFYCPSTNTDTSYFDWTGVTTSSTYAEGHGSVNLTLPNTDFDCNFRYFQYQGESAYDRMAVSNLVTFERTGPMHGHLALTGDITEMLVMFMTRDAGTPEVAYGTNNASLSSTAKGTSHTYAAEDMCGAPANTTGFVPPGNLHEVLMTGLDPGTTYYYQYGIAGNLSAIASFRSAPKPSKEYSFTFVAYADMGTAGGDAAQATAAAALREIEDGAELVIHAGDISYARGAAYIWDVWFPLIEPLATKVPYMVGIGNHEHDHTSGAGKDPSGDSGTGFHPPWGNFGDDSSGECSVPMYNRFTMPGNGNALFWYSYDYGSVHMIMVSTEHDCSSGSPQYAWLEKDLMSVDREVTPWIILAGHRPMYNSEKYAGDFKVSENMQRMYEDLLQTYKVDLAWWGHYHSYERTCPVYKQKCTPWGQGVVHMTIGSAGASLDSVGLYGKEWSLFFDDDFGFARISVANSTALHWEYLRNKDRSVVDDVWIYKEGAGTITTEQGCTCKEPWGAAGDIGPFYGCMNPTGEVGNWCYVQEEGCGQAGDAAWDWCDHSPQTTASGCTCLVPYEYDGLKYYGCAKTPDTEYEWCYVSGQCGTSGGGGYWDKC